MAWIGPRQRLLIERAVGSGAIRVTTRTDKNSALHAHDRGLLRRGADGETYHPTAAAREEYARWQEPGTWKTLLGTGATDAASPEKTTSGAEP